MAIPVVIVPEGGLPVHQVEDGAPQMIVATNGLGTPITLTDAEKGAPFIIQGVASADVATVLSTDIGEPLADDDDQIMETY